MRLSLKRETKRLQKSWTQYPATMLRDYLVEDLEDPRLNIQSILSRHFLIEALFPNRFAALQEEELRFAAAMNWAANVLKSGLCAEDAKTLLYALPKSADHAAGVEIPSFVSKTFATLPTKADGMTVPNYLEELLLDAQLEPGRPALAESRKSTFQLVWRKVLARKRPHGISVLEPACGSANDYRFLESFGLARLLDYHGFDLCKKNIDNAKNLFPYARFAVGNTFAINELNKSFDYCFVHDLFEHLSLDGLETAIAELCRVTRKGICAGFFNMAEIDEHQVRPVDDYHWNSLSMARVREIFERHGSSVQVIHIGAFLRWRFQCAHTHNEGAYTFRITLGTASR